MAKKDLNIRVEFTNWKSGLYEPFDTISGIATVTNPENMAIKMKKLEVQLKETWLQYGTRTQGNRTTWGWFDKQKNHIKYNLGRTLTLSPDDSEQYQFEVSMPKKWKERLKPKKFRNWEFGLFIYYKTGMVMKQLPGYAKKIPVYNSSSTSFMNSSFSNVSRSSGGSGGSIGSQTAGAKTMFDLLSSKKSSSSIPVSRPATSAPAPAPAAGNWETDVFKCDNCGYLLNEGSRTCPRCKYENPLPSGAKSSSAFDEDWS